MISVIVPVYNVEIYLRRCVDSILSQTYSDLEIWLVDDGSTDNSGVICDEYQAMDNRIKVIHQNNQGLSGARNVAIKLFNGEYVTFVDSDDFIHPQMIEMLYKKLIENNVDIAMCGYEKGCDESFDIEKDIEDGYEVISGHDLLLNPNGYAVNIACAKLYTGDNIKNIAYPIGKLHEDDYVTYKILYETNRLVFLYGKLYYYFQRNNSITTEKITYKHLNYMEAYLEQSDYYGERSEIVLEEKYMKYALEQFCSDYYKKLTKEDRKKANNTKDYSCFCTLYDRYKDKKWFGIKTSFKLFLIRRTPWVINLLK